MDLTRNDIDLCRQPRMAVPYGWLDFRGISNPKRWAAVYAGTPLLPSAALLYPDMVAPDRHIPEPPRVH